MATGLLEDDNENQYRATHMWQEVVRAFRAGMPTGRRRVKMKIVDDAFSGSEAVDWLLEYMQSSGKFNSVSRSQVITLLQKFFQSDVIEDARGKDVHHFESGSHLYRFVKMPGPLNFLDEDAICITNSYALAHPDETQGLCSSDELTARTSPQSIASLTPSNEQEMAIWKEVALKRLVVLLDRPCLDDVLADTDVDGRVIVSNILWAQHQQKLPTPEPQQQPLPTSRSHHSNGQQSSQNDDFVSERESAGDVPDWTIMAIRCLSKWPERCSEEFLGGLPLYAGFEQDVLSSLVQYYSALKQPLVISKLYQLHMAILPLLEKDVRRAVDALQLCSLFLPQSNRVRLHRTLRFINKASTNERLHLSLTSSNQKVLLEYFSKAVLRSEPLTCPGNEDTTEREQQLVWAMSQNYRNIFRVPLDLQREVELHLHKAENGQSSFRPMKTSRSFCQQVTEEEYQQQSRDTSSHEIAQLLDAIVRDENMPSKTKKQRLKQFQRQYPKIYRDRFPQCTPATSGAKHSKRHSQIKVD